MWAVSRPVLLVTQVSRILHQSKILYENGDGFDDNGDGDDFDDFEQVMGLATIKRDGVPALQVKTDQQNDENMIRIEHDKNRVAKCQGFWGYIRVKMFAVWGKKFARTCNFAK